MPRKETKIVLEAFPDITFLGWRSTHRAVEIAGCKKPVYRAVIVATAILDGVRTVEGLAILRPGDTFDKEVGKRIALGRLIEHLLPLHAVDLGQAWSDVRLLQKKLRAQRSKLFQEIWKATHKGRLPSHTFSVYLHILRGKRPFNYFAQNFPPSAPSVDIFGRISQAAIRASQDKVFEKLPSTPTSPSELKESK